MKKFAFISIYLFFLLFSPIISQIDNLDQLLHNNNQNEKIMLHQKLNHQFNHPVDHSRIKDNRSNRIINKTVFENEYQLVESLEQNWHKNDSVWVNNLKSTYTYDEGQNLLQKEQKEWNDSVWTNSRKWSYAYDDRDNLVKWEDEYWKDSIWEASRTTIYTYNESNDLIVKTNNDYSYLYKYNSNHVMTEYFELYSFSTGWDTIFTITYDYDQNDYLINQHEYEVYGTLNDILRYGKIYDKSYWYDEKYNLTRIYSISYTPIRYYERLNTTFTYDDYDRVIEKRRNGEYHYHSDSWSEYGHELYSYEKDNLIEEISQGELSDREKILYTYDENNNLIEKLVYDTGWSIEQPEFKKREKIQYKYSTILKVKSDDNQSQVYELSNNYPNPFNPIAKIDYYVPIKSFITLKVFDVLGNEIKTLVNSSQSVGKYKVEFDGSDLSSGLYFYRLQAGDFVETKKMILMK
ncbi:MAG: T9SS type A sorting domain-containing protein [Ignavibacteriae bacterium]|nr:T9SS type A sorting domain-containing protein [Ignavibacteriota bacterium]